MAISASLYTRKSRLAIGCWMIQQIDASTYATGYKVSDSSVQQATA